MVVGGGWLTDPSPGVGLPPEVGAILATATFGGPQTWRRYAEIRHTGGVVARGRATAPSRWATATTSSSCNWWR